jgi:hypothetical protein
MNGSRIASVLFLLLALVAGAAWWLQREAAAALRAEIELLQADHQEIARLTSENARLAKALPASDELARLRADHAAVMRMRAELEKLRANVEQREKALATESP